MNYATDNKFPLVSNKIGWPWNISKKELVSTRMPSGMLWPRITIVTPSYNQGEFIEETIRSVLLQGYPNLEYIIIDGKSSDNSVEVILKYERWISYWVSEPDEGQAHAVNKGFEHSTGEILAWLNSDDTYEEGALFHIAELMMDNASVDVVYGNVKIIDEHSRKIAELRSVPFDSKAFFYETVHIASQSAVFWRRALFLNVGMLNQELHYSMDRDLLIKFINSGAKFEFTRSLLGTYRCHAHSKTFGTSNNSRQELLKLVPFSTLTQKRTYPLWKLIYRMRQFIFLTLQGDIPYMVSRFITRLYPSAFDRL